MASTLPQELSTEEERRGKASQEKAAGNTAYKVNGCCYFRNIAIFYFSMAYQAQNPIASNRSDNLRATSDWRDQQALAILYKVQIIISIVHCLSFSQLEQQTTCPCFGLKIHFVYKQKPSLESAKLSHALPFHIRTNDQQIPIFAVPLTTKIASARDIRKLPFASSDICYMKVVSLGRLNIS